MLKILLALKMSPLASHWQESRSREILEEKLLLVFPLELEKWIFMSRSPLDFQDFEKTFLFPLSVHKIFVLNFSFSSRFSRFCKTISLSPLDFQDLQNNFSSSSRFSRFCRTLSLSPLDFQDLKKSFSPLDIRDFFPCFSLKLGLRCLPLTFIFHLRRNILNERWNPPAKTNGCWCLFVVWSHPRSPCGLPADDHPHRPESHQQSLSHFQMHFWCCIKNHFTGDWSRRSKLFHLSLFTL